MIVLSLDLRLLIGVSTGGTSMTDADYERIQISPDHAFSILAAHVESQRTQRFILIRDPHSHSRYTENALNPNILKELRAVHPDGRSTGAFWIVWPKFLRYFSSITISKYQSDLYDLRQPAKFTATPNELLTAFYLDFVE